MSKISKRLKDARARIEPGKIYRPEEAIDLVKSTAGLKFDATVEVHAHLGIDPKKGDQIVRASVVLPHGSGKKVKVAAFVPEAYAKDAKSAGADIVGGDELIEQIKKDGKCDFDIAVTVPEMMKNLAGIAKVLGQKGLMPNPKTGTIDTDVKKMISELKAGKVSFKNDDTGNVHTAIGKASYTAEQLLANFQVFVEVLKKAKPQSMKGTYLLGLYLTSTMGPSIKVSIN
ncbi:MAG: 50S ribosomal protein L1 [Patescibacteria group bacterium]